MISKRKHLISGFLTAFAVLLTGTEALGGTVCIKTASGACKTYTVTQSTGGVDASIVPTGENPVPDPAITQFGLDVTPSLPKECGDEDECDDETDFSNTTTTASSSLVQQPKGVLSCADPGNDNAITLVLVPQNTKIKPFSNMSNVDGNGSAVVKTSALDPSDPNYLKNFSLLQSLCPPQNSGSSSSLSTSSTQTGKQKKDDDKKKKKKLPTIPKDFVPCDTTTLIKAEGSDDSLVGSGSIACSLPANQCTGNSEDVPLTFDANGIIGQASYWEYDDDESSISPLEFNCQEILTN